MRRRILTGLASLALLGPAAPHAVTGAADVAPEEAMALTSAIDARLGAIVPNVFQEAKATYLDDYGLVVTAEVALAQPRNPFVGPGDPELTRSQSRARLDALQEGAVEVLGERVPEIDGLLPEERVTLVIYVINPNPVDLPDLPAQLVFSVRKRDADDYRAGALDDAAFRQRVGARED